MNIACLIAGPGSDLSAGFVERLSAKWRAEDWRWLNPGKAAEIVIPRGPDGFNESREEAHSLGCDLVVLPAQGRRKRLLVADMDSTVIGQECIDELAAAAGLGEQVAGITRRAMNGEIKFTDALKERVGLLKGHRVEILESVWRERITLTGGGAELVATMRANGGEAVLISGGFTAFTSKVAQATGFGRHYANELLTSGGRLTGAVREPILGRESKREILCRLFGELNVSAEDTIAVGDGANDIQMLQTAGLGVAFHAKPIVNEQIPNQIRFADLTALLYLQGYRRDEFSR